MAANTASEPVLQNVTRSVPVKFANLTLRPMVTADQPNQLPLHSLSDERWEQETEPNPTACRCTHFRQHPTAWILKSAQPQWDKPFLSTQAGTLRLNGVSQEAMSLRHLFRSFGSRV